MSELPTETLAALAAAGGTQKTAETAAAAGLVQAGTPEDAVTAFLGAGAADVETLSETGVTVDGGGTEERVVAVGRYAFLADIDGTKYHLSASRGDKVLLTEAEAKRGDDLGAFKTAAEEQVAAAEEVAPEDEPAPANATKRTTKK
jgi:hypothetical protein